MTFTQFLTRPSTRDLAPSFSYLVRTDPMWPASANRLEDFESVLLARLEDCREEAVAELHNAWRLFAVAEPSGKHDLDLALSAWSDYARHLRSCEGSRFAPCTVAEKLLARALGESAFDDLQDPLRVGAACDSDEEVVRDEDDADGDPDTADFDIEGDQEDDEEATDLF